MNKTIKKDEKEIKKTVKSSVGKKTKLIERKKVVIRKDLNNKKEEKDASVIVDAVEKDKKKFKKTNQYFEATGRRKMAVARVRILTQGEKAILINGKKYQDYFPTLENQQIVVSPLEKMNILDSLAISVKVKGGGFVSQAEAIRHGISRALLVLNSGFRKKLKKAGFLTRDSRTRERKKFGLKRARRAPQWRKR